LHLILNTMLQRIQTVWIFLAILGAIFLFVTGQDFSVFGPIPFISVVCVGLVLVGFISILSYKDRKRQILLNNISIFINALLLGLLAYWLLSLSGGINFPEKGIEPIFPLLSIICLLIANIYIRKDERLVKSVDRLR
jgi:ABC-type tungstate transport system substrate-binding protein